MIDKKKKKILSVIYFIIDIISIVLLIVGICGSNQKLVVMAIIMVVIFTLASLLLLVLYLKDKSQPDKTLTQSTQAHSRRNLSKSLEEIFCSRGCNDFDKHYDEYVEWCCEWVTDERDERIKDNSLLLGAYQIFWFDNEVCNGGFDQFWDYAEDWDMDQTAELFKWLLPKEIYTVFSDALTAHRKGEDCEKFNQIYDYSLMDEVLPKIAERVAHNYENKVTLTEYDLIKGITPYLKEKGYKKANKRWTKIVGDFTLVFFIQGSCYDVDGYYIRPGIIINALKDHSFLGDFSIGIEQTNLEQVISDYETFIEEWTDKKLIKSRLIKFLEWEERNPLEKRRNTTENERAKDPVPEGCGMLFQLGGIEIRQYILDNF